MINEFRGKKLIDIREYYMADDGTEKPGRKGDWYTFIKLYFSSCYEMEDRTIQLLLLLLGQQGEKRNQQFTQFMLTLVKT